MYVRELCVGLLGQRSSIELIDYFWTYFECLLKVLQLIRLNVLRYLSFQWYKPGELSQSSVICFTTRTEILHAMHMSGAPTHPFPSYSRLTSSEIHYMCKTVLVNVNK